MSLFSRIEPELRRQEERFEELESTIQDPAVAVDPVRLTAALKERGRLEATVVAYRALRARRQEIVDTRAELETTDDPEMQTLCRELLDDMEASLPELERGLLEEFVRDEDEAIDRLILEVRAGTGGDEATLWASELLRMYEAFAVRKGWRTERLELHASEADGVREATLAVEGKGSYALLRYESGGHRVQRVPVTETQGRIHTSAATVAVLPEPETIAIEIKDADLRIDTYRASGAGGQHVNKTSSAIRVTHEPSGLVVTCQDEKSQHKNKARALRILRTRLHDRERQRIDAERSTARKSLIGSGDRSERIRTYNFPQSRVTDHRINFTTHDLAGVLQGDLEGLSEALATHDKEERLAALVQER